jgi:hypothetical protein
MAGDGTLTALLSSQRPTGYNQSIYHDVAPGGARPPYVIFSKTSGTPQYTFMLDKPQMDDELWLIKGVVQDTDSDAADRIATELDALFTDIGGSTVGLSISGQTALYMRRETDVEYSEVVNGDMYFHAGAQYRLRYTSAT